MREKWARRIALLTGLLVLLLAVFFALIQNPAKQFETTENRQQTLAEEQSKLISLDASKIEAGREVYKQLSCARCHSIAGKGNPRNPLDGVGEKHSTAELRDWITGGDSLVDELPEYILNLKQTYKKLSDDELESLITYLQSLRQ